jgi:hypothetical protein
MRQYVPSFVLTILLAAGCATAPPPGTSGQVRGPLTSIEIYTKRPERGSYYSTTGRQRLFASDQELYVVSSWSLPDLGEYVSTVTVTPPSQGAQRKSEYRFRPENVHSLTIQPFRLPTGEEARSQAGEWRVEVALNGSPVGTRSVLFEASSIRLRTEAKLYIAEGIADPEAATGDYIWLNQYAAREMMKATASVTGRALRDELGRRFPDVMGPGPMQAAGGLSIVLNPVLRMSPNPSIPSRLELEIHQPGTGERRVFEFKSTAGSEYGGGSGRVYFSVAAADLALQAGSSPEVLDFLIRLANATPE